jgi:hypothetical protein
MKELIAVYQRIKKETTKELKKYVQNKNIPLEKRWYAFTSVNLGYHCISLVTFDTICVETLYDARKYETVYTENLIDYLQEVDKDNFEEVFYLEKAEDLELDFEILLTKYINKFKEEVLDKFLYAYDMNW